MAPYRLWEKDLLHACLTANLLLDDRSHTGEPAVMFEYENLGDYYKAGELLQSKMDVKGLLRWIDDERKYLERNITVPSEKSGQQSKLCLTAGIIKDWKFMTRG